MITIRVVNVSVSSVCVRLFILLSALCHSLVEKITYSSKTVLPLCDYSIYEICKLQAKN